MTEPQSILTRLRPDIWADGLRLATALTGFDYAPKYPLPDGTIYACGGGYYQPPPPPRPRTGDEIRRDEANTEIRDLTDKLRRDQEEILRQEKIRSDADEYIERLRTSVAALKRLIQRKTDELEASAVVVPEGAMEWLLHEVGHWIASSENERCTKNYALHGAPQSHADAREMQAMVWEEIVFAPYGRARSFVPPSQRDGAAFERDATTGAFVRVMQRVSDSRIDIEEWRAIWGKWVTWGHTMGRRAPWKSVS